MWKGSYLLGYPPFLAYFTRSETGVQLTLEYILFFLAAEPIIMEGSPKFKILEDKWTAISADNKRCLILFFWYFLRHGTNQWQPKKIQTNEFSGMVDVVAP